MSRRKTGRGRSPRARGGPTPEPAPHKRRSTKKAPGKTGRSPSAKPSRGSRSAHQTHNDARRLVEVHNHYRRELRQVRNLLRQVKKDGAAIDQMRGRINALALTAVDGGFSEICRSSCQALADHHKLEDRSVFPHLLRSQRSLQPVLDRLGKEHRTIHALLQDVDKSLVHLARNPGEHAPVARAIDLLIATVFSHFIYEERELLGPLARHGFPRSRR